MILREKQGVVLFVDDEPAIVNVMTQFLNKLDYEVVPAFNGSEALKRFDENLHRIKVVITNLSMPGFSGADLTKRIKADYPGIPIIICTGYGETIGRQMTEGLGISAYLGKPTTLGELAIALQNVLTKQ